jgi:hypothetical protein
MDILNYVFSDNIWFWLVEAFIVAVFFRAVVYDIKAYFSHVGELTRGSVSRGILISFWALAIILIEIIISSNVISNHRIIVGLLNLGIFLYLFFFSSYFTNKIIGWSQKLQKRKYYVR